MRQWIVNRLSQGKPKYLWTMVPIFDQEKVENLAKYMKELTDDNTICFN